jgi:hypothetical protein
MKKKTKQPRRFPRPCKKCGVVQILEYRNICKPCFREICVQTGFKLRLKEPNRGKKLTRYACPIGVCKNCKRNGYLRPRDLCFRCYVDPSIKDKFPRLQLTGGRRTDDPYKADFEGKAKLPPEPTSIPAGPGRVEVYIERAKKKWALFHPLDTKAIHAEPIGCKRPTYDDSPD